MKARVAHRCQRIPLGANFEKQSRFFTTVKVAQHRGGNGSTVRIGAPGMCGEDKDNRKSIRQVIAVRCQRSNDSIQSRVSRPPQPNQLVSSQWSINENANLTRTRGDSAGTGKRQRWINRYEPVLTTALASLGTHVVQREEYQLRIKQDRVQLGLASLCG